jgi:hypothetical protein
MRPHLPVLAFALAVAALGAAPIPKDAPKGLVEKFARPTADATKGYGLFAYEATDPKWKAEVSEGRLRLSGAHEEGEQRLVVTARKVFGKPKWPDALEVTAKLGGTGAASGAWHVGLSVGAVKVLFHPDYDGGAFRAETVDTRTVFSGNENMGFTPAAGVMHELTVKVSRGEKVCRFDVTVANGGKAGGAFTKSFEVPNDQVGDFDRIGLERSGRTGGDGLFESVAIKPGR